MIQSLIVGTFLAMITIGIHAVGTSLWIDYIKKHRSEFSSRIRDLFGEVKILSFTAITLLLLHVMEVVVWAVAYMWFVDGEFGSFEEAVYFSTVTFASLGYGDVVIVGSWRMLSAYQAMTGLLVFGWSSALLFTVVQKIWQEKYELGK